MEGMSQEELINWMAFHRIESKKADKNPTQEEKDKMLAGQLLAMSKKNKR
jgi:hypothetical protein